MIPHPHSHHPHHHGARPIDAVMVHRRPVTALAGTTVQQAAILMRDHGVGAVLVTNLAGVLVGIFTGRDAVRRVMAMGLDPRTTCLAEVMTPKPDCLGPHVTAIDALRLMHDAGFRHIPIAEGGRLLGIVSLGDFHGLERARLDDETGLWERL